MDRTPPDWARYLFWLIAGCLSVCFAEILSGSYLFPYFTFEGLFIILPVYGLHLLVLAFIVYRFGRARLPALFLAGAIFGLYEAYITKIIWSPPWGSAIWLFQGIAVVEMLVLVLFWHPLFSFILALFTAESVLTRSREVLAGMPGLVRSIFARPGTTYLTLFIAAMLFGLYQGSLSPSPVQSIASIMAAAAVLGILIFIYRRIGLHQYEIRQLLPMKREFIVLLVLLLTMYAIFGISIRSEALPGTIPQLIVLLMYAFFFALLYLSVKKSRKIQLPAVNFGAWFSWRAYAGFFGVIAIVSALVSLTAFHTESIKLAFWFVGSALGLVLLAFSIWDTLLRTGPSAR